MNNVAITENQPNTTSVNKKIVAPDPRNFPVTNLVTDNNGNLVLKPAKITSSRAETISKTKKSNGGSMIQSQLSSIMNHHNLNEYHENIYY